MSKITLKRHKGGWCSTNNMDYGENTFTVVEFLQKPVAHIAKYVTVPDTWIKARANKIGVLFPKIEQVQHIRKYFNMIPHNTPSLNWTEYLSEIKYTARSYEDAQAYIMIKNHQERHKKNRSGNDNNAINPSENKQEDRRTYTTGINATDIDLSFYTTKLGDFFFSLGQLMYEFSSLHTSTLPQMAADASQYTTAEDDETDYDEATTLKRKRTTLVLPPEYDENDSRWTLRHREKKPGLEKLVNGYEVYVDDKNLANILNLATGATQLAKLLAVQIFSKNALGVCSMTGRKSRFCKTETRPGLHKDGVDALIKFIRRWEGKKGWSPVDAASLLGTIRNIIKVTRKQRERLLKQNENE